MLNVFMCFIQCNLMRPVVFDSVSVVIFKWHTYCRYTMSTVKEYGVQLKCAERQCKKKRVFRLVGEKSDSTPSNVRHRVVFISVL